MICHDAAVAMTGIDGDTHDGTERTDRSPGVLVLGVYLLSAAVAGTVLAMAVVKVAEWSHLFT